MLRALLAILNNTNGNDENGNKICRAYRAIF